MPLSSVMVCTDYCPSCEMAGTPVKCHWGMSGVDLRAGREGGSDEERRTVISGTLTPCRPSSSESY